ncbi:GAF and ANTAR domain-containing protein [Streptomyces sp. TRM66268-LWL]|uniref:GAF and ANTAR domain-containing protein n=1 Tax=Streptomyces polyasparticus TaxID=2767826 RepID=A0ABR7SK34_9ACTN|nr:GAF and ANTAR domain-containing protein [Streptomyces polyasparticus]MBC9715803.1 GAF and ANTAR domain-containing protein [Streptomyces polyasparticus]
MNDKHSDELDPATLQQLHALLLGAERLEEFLGDLVHLTVDALRMPVSCGVTLETEHRPATVVSSDALAERLDQEQYSLGDGPCLDALRRGQFNHVPDMAAEERWAPFRSLALAQGVRSSLSTPLIIPGHERATGVFNLYAQDTDAFDEIARAKAASFSGYAAGALGVALKVAHHVEFGEDLRAALATRPVIDQALGIIMAQQRCDAESAFEILRRASRNRNVKLHAVARGIIEAASGKPPSAPPFNPRV